jgi:hypothetical protein
MRCWFDELRTDFLPKAAQHSGFRGFQYVLAEQGRAIGILWYEQPADLDGITGWSAPGFRTTSRHAWQAPRPRCVAASSST